LWDVVPCSLVEIGRRFRGATCHHHVRNDRPLKRWPVYIRLHDATFYRMIIFILIDISCSLGDDYEDEYDDSLLGYGAV
jgi:hypothetical protein